MTVTAVGYARISKDDTLEGRGVGRQSQDIAGVCQRNGWSLAEVLVDNDISASRYGKKARPQYGRLLELIASGAVDRAVVYDVDRLLRQPRELEDLIDLCELRKGAFGLHNVNGELDLVTSSGRFIARMLVAKSAMESDDLSRRLRRSFDQKALEGRPHGGRAFGYERDGVTVNEREAALLREAAADVLAGCSLNSVARRWNDLGIATPQRHRPWVGTVVRAVLTNPRQAGLRVHRGDIIGDGVWPAILDRPTHERLIALFRNPRPRTPPRRTPFTSLVRDVNGVPLDRDVVRGRPTYRGHKRPGREAAAVSITAEPLEALILDLMFTAVEAGDVGRHLASRGTSAMAVPDIGVLERDLAALADDFGTGRITRLEWMAARPAIEERLRARRLLDARSAPVELVDVDLRGRWSTLDVDRQRAVLAAVFEAVLIRPAKRKGGPGIEHDRIEPRWRS